MRLNQEFIFVKLLVFLFETCSSMQSFISFFLDDAYAFGILEWLCMNFVARKSRLNERSFRRLLISLEEMISLMLLRGLRKNRRECQFR